MIRFLAVQHTFSEFLGALEPQFEARDIASTCLRPVTGQDIFANALQFDSLWLLGGAGPIGDTEHCPWVADEVRLVRALECARRPVVGLGFGARRHVGACCRRTALARDAREGRRVTPAAQGTR